LKIGHFFKVKRQVVKIISNLLKYGSLIDIEILITYGLMDVFCQLLTIEDQQLLISILKGMETILTNLNHSDILMRVKFEEYSRTSLLIELTMFPNVEIQSLARFIFDRIVD